MNVLLYFTDFQPVALLGRISGCQVLYIAICFKSGLTRRAERCSCCGCFPYIWLYVIVSESPNSFIVFQGGVTLSCCCRQGAAWKLICRACTTVSLRAGTEDSLWHVCLWVEVIVVHSMCDMVFVPHSAYPLLCTVNLLYGKYCIVFGGTFTCTEIYFLY